MTEILLIGSDGHVVVMEANESWSGKMPVRDRDIEVLRFHIEAMAGDKQLIIVTTLDPTINCPAEETGTWSVMNVSGKWRLEYVTDSLYGRPTRHSNVYQWDIDSEDVVTAT